MMLIVREVTLDDMDSLWDMIHRESPGMTTLMIDREQLTDRIEQSCFAFQRRTERISGTPYVFVMEDSTNSKLVGTSCVFSKTGGYEPFYGYRVVKETQYSKLLELHRDIRSLHLVKIHDGPSELGSLFLSAEYRGSGAGRLLSLARFIYMAAHPKRFADQTIAEMRGYLNELGESPFWNAIGAHFFPIDYPHADRLSMIDKRFIEDLMPKYPIYLDLLPADAIDAIGRVHLETAPALRLLEREGFTRSDMIDIFDGGPAVQCPTSQIRTVQRTRSVTVSIRDAMTHGQVVQAIVARTTDSFRAVRGNVVLEGEHHIGITQDIADAIRVIEGAQVSIDDGQ